MTQARIPAPAKVTGFAKVTKADGTVITIPLDDIDIEVAPAPAQPAPKES